MSSLEHYFENLLFNGRDVNGDFNKNTLTAAEQEAVRVCADYVLYTIFLNRDDFLKFIHINTKADCIRHMSDENLADWLCRHIRKCSECVAKDMCEYTGVKANGLLKWLKQEAET